MSSRKGFNCMSHLEELDQAIGRSAHKIFSRSPPGKNSGTEKNSGTDGAFPDCRQKRVRAEACEERPHIIPKGKGQSDFSDLPLFMPATIGVHPELAGASNAAAGTPS